MSNKKFSRSKKTDGGNVPNFVFNFGSNQPGSPALGASSPSSGSVFGAGSNPGSPAQGSFNFGSTTSQPFVFGDPNTSASSPTTFAFNSTKRGPSDLDLGAPERSPIRRAPSDITAFGTPTSTTAPSSNTTTTTTSQFAFNPPTTGLSSQLSFGSVGSHSSNISFSAPASTPTNTSAPGISFGAPPPPSTTTTSTTAPTTSSTTISFGSPAPPANVTTTAPASTTTMNAPTSTSTTGFTFGTSAVSSTPPTTTTTTSSTPTTSASTPAAPASVFTFGTRSSTAPTTPTTTPSSFTGFGSTTPVSGTTPTSSTDKSTTTTTTAAAAAATTSTTGFSFNTAPSIVTSTPSSASTLSFGKPTTSSDKPTTTGFSLPTATTSTTTTASDKPASTAFSFSSPKPAATTTTTTPSFNFGSSNSSASTTPSISTSTTTTTTTTTTTSSSPAMTSTAPPTSSLFSLGTTDKKTDNASSTPFTFGSTPATASAATATATAPVIPNQPNVFSFSKILEDLAKVEAQPPNQMYASLNTSPLSVLQPNQIVSHTSFRIDNILPSTRFSELPEQAQKELDALEKYVRLEGQRCEYIGNQKVPKHLETIEKSKKGTEVLSQQLDALTCTLKGQMESIEAFYENVKTQLRHANDGCAVIEACKHPGDNARWLFGHSEDEDYFSLLAKQLDRRLEEYKKCIWEIERTAESWSHNRMQSPQDVADIMRAQNQAFLALSSKVAALHENVNLELNHYNQYLRMCS
ncbi:hypothetical protein BD770DRAFT_383971 [Pilaira anomala]|nr:hypothetical protein BD770DRAFT_383971 [Pilaira anomala]